MKLEERFTYADERFSPIRDAAREATAAYQDAARGLDALKEIVLIEMGMPNTAKAIHDLAHEQPKRFDIIGDILHQRHLMQEYPATLEYTKRPQSLDEVFSEVIDMLERIEEALVALVRRADEQGVYPIARQAETLQIQNSESYEKFLMAWQMYDVTDGSATSYDNWILHLFEGVETDGEED